MDDTNQAAAPEPQPMPGGPESSGSGQGGQFSQNPPGPGAQHNSNMGMAILAYLGILVLIPLLTDAKHDPFVKFHIKQGLVLLVALIIASAVRVVPVMGWILMPFLWLASVILMIVGIMNVLNNKEKELPVIGQYSKYFHF